MAKKWTEDSVSVVSRNTDLLKDAYLSVMMGKTSVYTERDWNEMQDIQNLMRQEMYKEMVHSGVLDHVSVNDTDNTMKNSTYKRGQLYFDGDLWGAINYARNQFGMGVSKAIVNGIPVIIQGHRGKNIYAPNNNLIELALPPTYGTRDDLVFLEVWKEEVTYDVRGNAYGNANSSATGQNAKFEDTRVTNLTKDQTSRIALKWRIRTVEGVDFKTYQQDGFCVPKGAINTSIKAQGGQPQPTTSSTGVFYDANNRRVTGITGRQVLKDDEGLYVAGDGTAQSKADLNTLDGYVYAIPLFRVKRRNSSPFSIENPNGGNLWCTSGYGFTMTETGDQTKDVGMGIDWYNSVDVGDKIYRFTDNVEMVEIVDKYTTTSYGTTYYYLRFKNLTGAELKFEMGNYYIKPKRPDNKYSNIIYKEDIIDLRHKVSLTGFNYQQLLEENFDKLLRGELQTKDRENVVGERFGLTPAPLGMKKQYLPTTVQGDDQLFRDLYNYLYGDQPYTAGKYLHQLNDANLKLKVDGADKTGTNVFQLSKKSATMTSDFVGKTMSNSLDGNPHIAYLGTALKTGLFTPMSGDFTEFPSYGKLMTLDGTTDFAQMTTSGHQAQTLFSFNLIAHVERKYGITLNGTTADKVQWLKDNIKNFVFNWHGKGSSSTGNKASVSVWNGEASTTPSVWGGAINHTNATISKLMYGASTTKNVITNDGFIHFLTYAEPSNGTIASVIETDYVSLDVELHAHSSALEPNQPYFYMIDDLFGKVSGSTIVNPHLAKHTTSTQLVPPSGFGSEHSNTVGGWNNYNKLTALDNDLITLSYVANGAMSQFLYSFNIIEIVERKYGKIPAGDTAGKVQWLKDNLTKMLMNWWGKGSSPTGDKASMKYWYPINGTWSSYTASHTKSTVTNLPMSAIGSSAIPNWLTSDGFVHFLAYAEPSDGVTPSKIETDYINIEVELKAGAKVVDPKSFVYSVNDDDYNKVYTSEWDTTAISKKFPLVKNYQNIISNIVNPKDTVYRYSNGGVNIVGDTLTVATANNEIAGFIMAVKPNTHYTVIHSGTLSGEGIRLYEYASKPTDPSVGSVAIHSNFGDKYTFTTQANTNFVMFGAYAGTSITGIVGKTITKPVVIEGVVEGKPYYPSGQWLLPRDTASGETPTRIIDFNEHNQRRSWGDPQLSDTVSEIIDPVKTPQPHITVTQATAGKWSVNDTVKVKSENGIITGVIDTDTAIARIVGYADGQTDHRNTTSPKTQIKLDTVAGLAVNDTVAFVPWDNGSYTTRTITAIDTVNKLITLNTEFSSIDVAMYGLFEVTASSSLPVVKYINTDGSSYTIASSVSFSGLGTKEITMTVTAVGVSWDATKPIIIQYSVNYPAGKGIVNVHSETLEANVNGQKLVKASDNIVRIKANFAGKVSGSTDLVPHKIEHNSNGGQTSLIPATTAMGELGQTSYNTILALDGVVVTPSTNVSGAMAQTRFSFNVIRMIEDKLGEQFFNDCLTLADKVAKVSSVVPGLKVDWYGKGSSPSGNKASLYVWRSSMNTWALSNPATSATHTSASVAKLSGYSLYVGVTSSMIDANGFIHFLAYAEPSNGTVASTIETDYVEALVELNLAETGYDVLVPEEQFPTLVDNPKMFKGGENMLPPFTDARWKIHANAKVLSPYELELSATATNSHTMFDVPVIPNTKYSVDVQDATLNVFLEGIKSDGTTISQTNYTTGTKKTITTNSDVSFLRVLVTNGNTATGVMKVKNVMLTSGEKQRPFVPYNKDVKRKKKFDFLGKVAGSTFENPHKFRNRAGTLGVDPTVASNYPEDNNVTEISKQDGLLRSATTNVSGNYAQQVFEFDLSHLGMSLSELKSALRKLTVKWTGYGKGTNGTTSTFSATLKVWDNDTSVWNTTGTHTSSSPNDLIGTMTAMPLEGRRISKDQKMYVLAHSTYPAGTASPSEIYTDYVALEVELADYVDYVKGNVVKVRPQTKELKLQYPKKSYRSGQEDKVEILFKTVPYQGLAEGGQKPLLVDKNIYLTNHGTSEYVNTDIPRLAMLPVPSADLYKPRSPLRSYQGGYSKHSVLLAMPARHGGNGYRPFLHDRSVNIEAYSHIEDIAGLIQETAIGIICGLGLINGELYLVVNVDEVAKNKAYVKGLMGKALYKLDGRPIIKEVN